MKFRDCKKGTCVKVYDHVNGLWFGIIKGKESNGTVYVIQTDCHYHQGSASDFFYPEQLRKCKTKRKKKKS